MVQFDQEIYLTNEIEEVQLPPNHVRANLHPYSGSVTLVNIKMTSTSLSLVDRRSSSIVLITNRLLLYCEYDDIRSKYFSYGDNLWIRVGHANGYLTGRVNESMQKVALLEKYLSKYGKVSMSTLIIRRPMQPIHLQPGLSSFDKQATSKELNNLGILN
jgi:hypothetical protein